MGYLDVDFMTEYILLATILTEGHWYPKIMRGQSSFLKNRIFVGETAGGGQKVG